MDGQVIVVKTRWDDEAQVWYVEASDVPGLNAEAPSVEGLLQKLPGAVADLMGPSPCPAGAT